MPYVHDSRREALSTDIANLLSKIHFAGDLSYVITMLVLGYGRTLGNQSYHNMATLAGILDLTHREFVRRRVDPYEDNKCEVNGDVY